VAEHQTLYDMDMFLEKENSEMTIEINSKEVDDKHEKKLEHLKKILVY